MAKIAVLGSTGMLGHTVYRHLSKAHDAVAFARHPQLNGQAFDALKPDWRLLQGFDYIVNCIGVIKPYCKDDDPVGVLNAIKINSEFPWELSRHLDAKTRVIQIATDCVYAGEEGAYCETSKHDANDVYGKTKSLGEVFSSPQFLNIRCSIIGPEEKAHVSLLDWFRSQPKGAELKGFSHHTWNGVTTLQFAQLCDRIIQTNTFDKLRQIGPTHHFLPNEDVNKFEMLNVFAEVFGQDVKITDVNNVGQPVNRTVRSNYNALAEISPKVGFKKSITDLKSWMSSEGL